MKTKEEKVALVKNMLEALELTPQDLLENVENSPKVTPQFLDIQVVNGVPCMFIRHNEKTQKNEWLCLEVPDEPMTWDEGRKWCQSKGGDYGKIPLLKFISERKDEINVVLKANDYPVIEGGWHWSTEGYNGSSWGLNMNTGNNYNYFKYSNYYVRAVVVTG